MLELCKNSLNSNVYVYKFSYFGVDYGILIATTVISGCSTYLDKLLIYPMLGATAIAYYQTASIISKVLPMIAGAMSNVLLSYLVKIDSISKKFFLKLICLGAIVASFGFVICNKIVIIFIKIFYPTFLDSCIDIIPYANVIAILQMSYIFIYPYSMRFNKRKRLYVIELCELIPYCILSLILIDLYGIVGFCIATIFAISFKLIVAVLLILKNIE